MDRGLVRIVPAAVALVAAALLASACGRQLDAPVRPPVRADIVLPVETQTIEALVPRHATLETLLRAARASCAARAGGDRVGARGVRPPPPSRRSALPPRPVARRLPARVRVPDRRRSLPAHRQSRRSRAGRARRRGRFRTRRRSSVVAIRGHIDGDHPSVIAAMDATGETSAAGDGAGRDLQRSDRLRQRSAAGRLVSRCCSRSRRTTGSSPATAPILGARFVTDGSDHQAFRWTDPATRQGRLLRRERPSLKRFFLRVAAAVRAAHHVGLLAQPPASRLSHVSRAPRRRLRRAAGRAGRGGRQRHRRVGGLGRRRRQQVRLRHASGFESYYLHLSAFAHGIRAGRARRSGQLIGRVGATGTATGPHLDYRLRKNGVFVNPRREHARQPPGEPIPRRTARSSARRATTCCSSSRRRSPGRAAAAAAKLQDKQ